MSAQLDQLHVTGLSCCVRLCMYMRVRESALLLLLHMCVKSQKSGQLQMCMYVCMYVCLGVCVCVRAHYFVYTAATNLKFTSGTNLIAKHIPSLLQPTFN